MSALFSAVASILVLAGLAWATRRLLRLPVCPICIGVAGTWLWMLIARELGIAVDTAMLAILLGGSVAGIAFQLEKYLSPARSPALWKALSLPAGFAAAYGIAAQQWLVFALSSVVSVLLAGLFFSRPAVPQPASETVEDLKRRMQQCC